MKKTVKLLRKHYRGIRDWVNLSKYSRLNACPFHTISDACANICRELFPKLKEVDHKCPCDCYSSVHVTLTARHLLMEGNKRYKHL